MPAPEPEPRRARDLTGRGLVLLVEDEDPVRSFAARALRLRGYTVVEAASGEEALEILQDPGLHVDIMLSDVIMPGLDGPAWVREAQQARPGAKVIFMSGYAEDAFVGGDSGVPGSGLPAEALHPQRADPEGEGPARGVAGRRPCRNLRPTGPNRQSRDPTGIVPSGSSSCMKQGGEA